MNVPLLCLLGPLVGAPHAIVPTAAALQPASPAKVEFRWDAPAGCPEEAHVVAQLETLLGGPLAARQGDALTAIARVRRDPDGLYDLRLWTVSAEGTLHRSLRHEQCDMLAQAGVLIAAMTIDPLAAERMADGGATAAVAATAAPTDDEPPEPEPPEPEPLPTPPPTVEPPPEQLAPAPNTPKKQPRKVRGAVRAGVGLAFGDLPGVGASLRLTPALVWPRVRVELELAYNPVRRARFDDRPDLGADLQLAAGALRICPVFARGRLEFLVCAGAEVGAMSGRGVGFMLTSDGRLLWSALHLAPALMIVLRPRIALWVGVEGQIALTRPQFVVAGFGPVYQARAGGVRGLLGVEVRLP